MSTIILGFYKDFWFLEKHPAKIDTPRDKNVILEKLLQSNLSANFARVIDQIAKNGGAGECAAPAAEAVEEAPATEEAPAAE